MSCLYNGNPCTGKMISLYRDWPKVIKIWIPHHQLRLLNGKYPGRYHGYFQYLISWCSRAPIIRTSIEKGDFGTSVRDLRVGKLAVELSMTEY